MKLSDIKGDIAVKVNEILYTKFEEYLNEFIQTLPEKYKSTIKQEHSAPGRMLFEYNKEIKDFLSTGHGYFDKSWYNSYIDNNRLEKDAKVLGLVQGKGPVENFKFENKYFSGNISISSFAYSKAWGGYSSNSIYHRANVYLKIKDIDALMKELDQALGNKTSLGHKKLKDARGVEIKVGDIVACSDSHYAGVWLSEVIGLSDVQIRVTSKYDGRGEINKCPGDVVVVSREAITKK
jgi:hypothetical protein